jgi:hypothetical protein
LFVANPVVPFIRIFLDSLEYPLPASFREQQNRNVGRVVSGVPSGLLEVGKR